ncbi:MAG: GNAT family N-acetyltransferase [Chloroflexi bacterium]|nr:GNAT family N-acetyltransferase [Chloroflexota bacterium]MBV9899400.1 GNAT family N-acetyltransferase [Chloroflexota bacterium]
MSEISIRAAEPEDAEAVHAILRCPGVVAGTLQLPWRPLAWTREHYIEGSGSGEHHLVAIVDGRVVGHLGLSVLPGARRRDVGKFGMAVHDEYHGRGVGTALMAAMVDLADNWLGLRRIELEVWADNAPAIHLYEKFGFEVEGQAREFAHRAGELVDALYMARLVRTPIR